MKEEVRPYYAVINVDNFEYNLQQIKKLTGGKKIIAIIKADAYGHGAVELSKIVEKEADMAAVAVLGEAIELRKSGFKKPILILGCTPCEFADEIVKYDITQSVFTMELAEAISIEAVKQNKTANIHIKIDTGMGRIGYMVNSQSVSEIKKISGLKNLKLEGIFTHFATSDEKDKSYTYIQLERFNKILKDLEDVGIKFELRHAANSAAIIDMPEAYFDAVRPGVILYGYYPSCDVQKSRLNLKPVMSLKAKIVYVKTVPEGCSISYGRKFITKRESRIATLPFGYADGYTRLLSGKANVIVNGKLAKIVGNICMDQCMVDVTDCTDVKEGTEVTVMGQEGEALIDANVLAEEIGTINYEFLCMVSKRVPRIYVNDSKIIKVKNYV